MSGLYLGEHFEESNFSKMSVRDYVIAKSHNFVDQRPEVLERMIDGLTEDLEKKYGQKPLPIPQRRNQPEARSASQPRLPAEIERKDVDWDEQFRRDLGIDEDLMTTVNIRLGLSEDAYWRDAAEQDDLPMGHDPGLYVILDLHDDNEMIVETTTDQTERVEAEDGVEHYLEINPRLGMEDHREMEEDISREDAADFEDDNNRNNEKEPGEPQYGVGEENQVGLDEDNRKEVTVESTTVQVNPAMLMKLTRISSRDGLFIYPGPYTTLPTDFTLGTVEAITFMPGLVKDPWFIERCQTNGWSVNMVVHIMNTMRKWPKPGTKAVDQIYGVSSIKLATRQAMRLLTGKNDWNESENIQGPTLAPRRASPIDYTAAAFISTRIPASEKNDPLIVSLMVNVKALPQGEDRGVLTEAIDFVKANPSFNHLRLSQIDGLIQQQNMPNSPYGAAEDLRCAAWWKAEHEKVEARYWDTTNGRIYRQDSKYTLSSRFPAP